jgi:hypothetical protein
MLEVSLLSNLFSLMQFILPFLKGYVQESELIDQVGAVLLMVHVVENLVKIIYKGLNEIIVVDKKIENFPMKFDRIELNLKLIS